MSDASDPDDWASVEFGAAQLGDARLTQRLIALAGRLSGAPQCSFPQSLKGADLKAAYRFFDNPKVDPNGVLGSHIGRTLERSNARTLERSNACGRRRSCWLYRTRPNSI
ncbi:transposase DNA-binding-containing protein, partial [Caballeronia sp. AAUFL_F1_KS47]